MVEEFYVRKMERGVVVVVIKMAAILLSLLLIVSGTLAVLDGGSKCDVPLGISYLPLKYPGRLENSQLSASSAKPYCNVEYGRLNHPSGRKADGVWCPAESDDRPWYQIDFRRMTTVRKIVMMGDYDQYRKITSYTVSYRYPRGGWHPIIDPSTRGPKLFAGVGDDIYQATTTDLGAYVTGRYFRIYPKSKNKGGNYCMQFEMRGCVPGKSCDRPVGLANASAVTDGQFSSSSVRQSHHAYDARLHNKFLPRSGRWGAWCPDGSDPDPWLEVDLKTRREISGLSTQGHPYPLLTAWTTQFQITYSSDGRNWTSFENGTIFNGNTDYSTIQTVIFNSTLTAKYVRYIPVAYNELPCVRMEMYECVARREAVPKLLKRLSDFTILRGEELLLRCVLEGQPDIQLAWHHNGKFLTTDQRVG